MGGPYRQRCHCRRAHLWSREPSVRVNHPTSMPIRRVSGLLVILGHRSDRDSYEVALVGDPERLVTAVYAELAVDRGEMIAHGARRDVERLRDLGVG